MYRILQTAILFSLMIVVFNTKALVAGENVDPLCTHFAEVYSHFSNIATPAFSALSIDDAGKLLQSVQKQVKGTTDILRINSSGIVINEYSSSEISVPMRSVADQQWFVTILNKRVPYITTSRDSNGLALFFWAWPIITASGKFGGVLVVKVDPSGIFSTYEGKDSIVVRVYYNETLLFRSSSQSGDFSRDAVWLFPDSSRLAIQYMIVGGKSGTNQGYSDLQKQNDIDVNEQKNNLHDEVAPEEPQVTQVSSSKKGSRILIYLILIVVLAAAWIMAKKMKKRDIEKGTPEHTLIPDSNQNSSISTEPKESYFDNGDVIVNDVDDVNELNDDSQIENDSDDETHEEMEPLSAEEACDTIKSFIAPQRASEFIEAVSSSEEFSTSDILRKELYREIHSQITHWVNYESGRLSQCLEEISERVGRLEHSSDPEIKKIRIEAQRVSKEIVAFKDNLPDCER